MRNLMSVLITLFVCVLYLSCKEATAENEKPGSKQASPASATPVEGAWKLVWAQYNDALADLSNHSQVKMFTNGSFSLFAHDTAGKAKFAGYGKYGFEGNTYHEIFLYHTSTDLIGGEDWQNLSVKGDTMYVNGFTKVVVGGVDRTAGWTKIREKLVRVNL